MLIKPDYHEALSNWGIALSDQAKSKTGEEADRLFTQAGEKYATAEAAVPGAAAYNLARLESLQGNHEGCRRWLEASRAAGQLPSRMHLDHDTDLDNVRDADWFQEFLSGL